MLQRRSLNVKPPSSSQCCARISGELTAVESERWRERLSDPKYRAFLVGLYRLRLTDDDAFTDSEAGADARFLLF